MRVTWSLPLKLVSRCNARGHWRGQHQRDKNARGLARMMTNRALTDARFAWNLQNSLRITITRIGKNTRPVDSDNLPACAKAIRDGIADELECDDGDKRLEWVYQQRRGEYGVEVVIEEL